MKVELTRKDLISLVRGKSPYYSVMNDPTVQRCGTYTGGFSDTWTWNSTFDDDLTEKQLWDLYVLCRDSFTH